MEAKTCERLSRRNEWSKYVRLGAIVLYFSDLVMVSMNITYTPDSRCLLPPPRTNEWDEFLGMGVWFNIRDSAKPFAFGPLPSPA